MNLLLMALYSSLVLTSRGILSDIQRDQNKRGKRAYSVLYLQRPPCILDTVCYCVDILIIEMYECSTHLKGWERITVAEGRL